jgi:hypothetical protein
MRSTALHPDLLHVVTSISNPVRYLSRWRLYERFAEQMERAGVHLVTIELAYGERPFAVTDAGNPDHIQIRTSCELWHKENLLNIAIGRLHPDWRYVAWIDADVSFHNPAWAAETIERLQLFDVLQLFSEALDLDPEHKAVHGAKAVKTGFMYSWWHGLPASKRYDDGNWHPGYAWAMRRDAYVALGGLLDTAVLGSADRHMAMALTGKAALSLPAPLHSSYRETVLAWQQRAEHHVRRNVNYVPGLLTHWWHGRKRERYYGDRWRVLSRWQFNPTTDLRRDWLREGLIELAHSHCPRLIGLRDDIRRYLRSRNEDSIDLV